MPLPPSDDYTDQLSSAFEAVTRNQRERADEMVTKLGVVQTKLDRKKAIPLHDQFQVWQRDRFSCRYCGARVIPPPVLRAASLVWPDDIPFHPHWKTGVTHPVHLSRAAAMDHLKPIAQGGNNAISNLVTSCWPCNAQKGEFTLLQLGWELLPITTDDWDGLIYAYQALWHHGRQNATNTDVKYHERWIATIFTTTTSSIPAIPDLPTHDASK